MQNPMNSTKISRLVARCQGSNISATKSAQDGHRFLATQLPRLHGIWHPPFLRDIDNYEMAYEWQFRMFPRMDDIDHLETTFLKACLPATRGILVLDWLPG